MLKKVQMRGGAQRPHARRSRSTLSGRPRAPTKQMGLFQHPARAALARGGPGALPCGADPHDGDDSMTTRLAEWRFTLGRAAALGLVIAGCMHPLASAPDVRTPYP